MGHTSGFTAATGCPRWGHHGYAEVFLTPPRAGYRIHYMSTVLWWLSKTCRERILVKMSAGLESEGTCSMVSEDELQPLVVLCSEA